MRVLFPAAHRVGLLLLILFLLNLPGPEVVRAESAGDWTRNRSPSQGDTLAVDRILVDLDAFRLYTFKSDRLISHYPIAVGMDTSPTPTGTFRVINKLKNPWYTPEDKPAKAPGPDNPLGTRWMGIDKPTYGLHGTRDPGSIGTRASEGCIRLRNEDAERLYRRVQRGTVVVIRRSTDKLPRPYVPATSVSYASLTRQGSYASLPSLVTDKPTTERIVKTRAAGRPISGRCRLNVPLDVPYIASCFLRGEGCPPSVRGDRVSSPSSSSTEVKNFRELFPGSGGGSGTYFLADQRTFFPSGGVSGASTLLEGRATRMDVNRWPSFRKPRSCEGGEGGDADHNQTLVCFLLSEPSESPHKSPGELVSEPSGKFGSRVQPVGSTSKSSGPPRTQRKFGEELVKDQNSPTPTDSDWERQRFQSTGGEVDPFPKLGEQKRCDGDTKTGHGVNLLDCGIP